MIFFREILGLMLELEETEYEIDQIEMLEVETAEAKRRLEVYCEIYVWSLILTS